jgi:hypothetical protein
MSPLDAPLSAKSASQATPLLHFHTGMSRETALYCAACLAPGCIFRLARRSQKTSGADKFDAAVRRVTEALKLFARTNV